MSIVLNLFNDNPKASYEYWNLHKNKINRRITIALVFYGLTFLFLFNIDVKIAVGFFWAGIVILGLHGFVTAVFMGAFKLEQNSNTLVKKIESEDDFIYKYYRKSKLIFNLYPYLYYLFYVSIIFAVMQYYL